MKRKQHRVELRQKGKGEHKAKGRVKIKKWLRFYVSMRSKSIKGEASSPIHTDRDGLQPAVSSSISEVNESLEEILFR